MSACSFVMVFCMSALVPLAQSQAAGGGGFFSLSNPSSLASLTGGALSPAATGNVGGSPTTGFIPIVVSGSGAGNPSGSGAGPSAGPPPLPPSTLVSPLSGGGGGAGAGFGAGILQPQPQPPVALQPPRTYLDLLSTYTAEFLSSLNRDQLVAFLRVYFMSRFMGANVLDPRSPVARSAQPGDMRAIETARSIPLSEAQLAHLENTGLGKILDKYATKLNSVPVSQRSAVIKEYYSTVDALKIPRGIKSALKNVI